MPLSGTRSIALDGVPTQLLSLAGEPDVYQLFPRSGTLTTITSTFSEISVGDGSLTAQVWTNANGGDTVAPLVGASCIMTLNVSSSCNMSVPITGGSSALVVITNVGSTAVFGVAEVGLAVT